MSAEATLKNGRWTAEGTSAVPVALGDRVKVGGLTFVITNIRPYAIGGPRWEAERVSEPTYLSGRRH